METAARVQDSNQESGGIFSSIQNFFFSCVIVLRRVVAILLVSSIIFSSGFLVATFSTLKHDGTEGKYAAATINILGYDMWVYMVIFAFIGLVAFLLVVDVKE